MTKEEKKILILETRFESISSEINEIKSSQEKTARLLSELPDKFSLLIKEGFKEHKEEDQISFSLKIDPLKLEVSRLRDKNIEMFKKIQEIEKLKWKMLGGFAVIAFFSKYFI